MGENYIRINDIVSFDMGNGRSETFAVYQLCITGMERVAVVSILSRLLHHMEIDPQEILLYRDSHDESIADLSAEEDDNPSVSGGAADSPTPLSAACGGISPRRGESALCTREPLEDEA